MEVSGSPTATKCLANEPFFVILASGPLTPLWTLPNAKQGMKQDAQRFVALGRLLRSTWLQGNATFIHLQLQTLSLEAGRDSASCRLLPEARILAPSLGKQAYWRWGSRGQDRGQGGLGGRSWSGSHGRECGSKDASTCKRESCADGRSEKHLSLSTLPTLKILTALQNPSPPPTPCSLRQIRNRWPSTQWGQLRKDGHYPLPA